MPDRPTAEGRLRRLLYVLPAARREGASLSDLARRLDCEPSDILRDLEEVTDREFYLPAGAAEDIQIAIAGDRVRVWTKGEFERPPRLTRSEAAALGLGLRAIAGERDGAERESLLATARGIEARIVGHDPEDVPSHFAVAAGLGASGGIRAILTRAAQAATSCEIAYLRPAVAAPDRREVEPLALAYANHTWYLIGHCLRSNGVRVFRLDRILEVRALGRSFQRPADFEPRDYLAGGHIFRSDVETEVLIRYDADVAPWVREREPVEETGDGAVLVRHSVADPAWLVRHVLRFGGSAEVLAPESARELIRTSAASILGAIPQPG